MKNVNSLKKSGFVLLLLAMAFVSCVPQKKMLYLKDAEMAAANISKEYINDRSVDYKLQPGDNLFIRVLNTIDERSASAISGEYGARNYLSSDASIYLQSYTLDEEGCIEMPLTGKIEVKNLTIDQAKAKLQTELDKFVNQTTIIVKLSNFNLTVLGEVTRPGMYKVYQSQINLFEAISVAILPR